MRYTIKSIIISFVIISLAIVSCNNETDKAPDLTFKTHKFTDKIHLFGNENYPSCDLDISLLAPKDSVFYKDLETKMLQVYFDTLYQLNANIDDLLHLNAQAFINEFKQQEEFLMQDTLDMGASFNWQIIVQNDITFQSERFLSFMKEIYTYTGGAHGNTNRFYFVYDLENEKILNSSELFIAEKCNELKDLQKKSLEKAGHDLSAFWLDGLKCGSNFYVVETGLVFHYDQYEIASYAAGPMGIFISFEDIEPFLQQPELFENLKKE